jgi:hypothetical protein
VVGGRRLQPTEAPTSRGLGHRPRACRRIQPYSRQ